MINQVRMLKALHNITKTRPLTSMTFQNHEKVMKTIEMSFVKPQNEPT
jgi:hypothetical protein